MATIVTLAAIVVVLAALREAQSLIMPIMLCAFVAWALNPLVRTLARLGLPRPVASALVIVTLLGGLAGAAYVSSDDALDAINRFPAATEKIRQSIRAWRRTSGGSINQLSEAASDLEAAAKDLAGARPITNGVARVEVVEPPLKIREVFLGGSKSLIDSSGELVTLAFFLYFVLASGDLFEKKAIALAAPTVEARRRLQDIIDETNANVEQFFLWLAVTSAILAALVAAAFWKLGLDHPVLWGIAAGVLDVVPYVGATVFLAAACAVSLLQFGTVGRALVVGAVGLLLTGFVGQWLKPWLMSRRAKLNTPAVFLALLFWGWMWGPIGMLLSFPMLVVIQTVADRVDRLKPVATLLGE